MTATDELRRLLDERGVELTANDGEHVKETCWPYMGELTAAFAEYDNGTTLFACDTWCFTPEQAIAATLGAREQPPYDELIEALRRDWDIEASWDGLRRFWYMGLTDEGVRKRDEREATLGRGTCRNVSKWVNVFECSECGFDYDFVTEPYQGPNFCPNCGRKVVEQ